MRAKGHVVTLLVLKHADQEWPVTLTVLRLFLRKRLKSLLRGLRVARRYLELFKPDLVHSHTYPANLFVRLLRLGSLADLSRLSGSAGPAVVNTIHNVYEGGWLRMLAYRLSSRLVDAVTAVSTAAAERYVQIGAVPADKMRVLTNGIDVRMFSPDVPCRLAMRAKMGASDHFVWLAAGRLAPAKDYPNLLMAFALVEVERPGTLLWIAGEGDGVLPEKLPGLRRLGLRRDVKELLDAADGFVLSSAWEGMPLVVGEAMAMGKPVAATRVGGVKELVGDAGVLVAAKDSAALAAAMSVVMAMSADERGKMGEAARDRVERLFSIEAKADEWHLLYEEIVTSRVL